jgi:F-type H+-transporting ATPase subunit epsilon
MALELRIVTPEGETYAGPVEGVVLPGTEGEFGVLPGHERVLATLRTGEAEIRTLQGSQYAALSEGFADVAGDRVIVMVETCELASDIDVARAERARSRAERELERLRRAADENHHFRVEQAALQRAATRLSVATRIRGPGA